MRETALKCSKEIHLHWFGKWRKNETYQGRPTKNARHPWSATQTRRMQSKSSVRPPTCRPFEAARVQMWPFAVACRKMGKQCRKRCELRAIERARVGIPIARSHLSVRVSNNAELGANKRIARSKQEIQARNRYRNDQQCRRKRVCQFHPSVWAYRGLNKCNRCTQPKNETMVRPIWTERAKEKSAVWQFNSAGGCVFPVAGTPETTRQPRV